MNRHAQQSSSAPTGHRPPQACKPCIECAGRPTKPQESSTGFALNALSGDSPLGWPIGAGLMLWVSRWCMGDRPRALPLAHWLILIAKEVHAVVLGGVQDVVVGGGLSAGSRCSFLGPYGAESGLLQKAWGTLFPILLTNWITLPDPMRGPKILQFTPVKHNQKGN